MLNFTTFVLQQASGFYKAFVFMCLYNWFAVEAFDLPNLTYWLSYGLLLTVSLLKIDNASISLSDGHYQNKVMTDEEVLSSNFGRVLLVLGVYTVTWFVGWVVEGWMI